ncbi:FKBP-type peptidyl-prolyl cis-trans isomerase [Streptacidiphilus sp. N1-12]|uniref:peptidylprolyl isomerase n=2 Tax=Streptacidiphilus alkalitolerans TaxID=3342712 RepID=A0ABV6W720_9ACTN
MRRLAAGLLIVPALLLTGCGSSSKAKSNDTAAPKSSASSSATPAPVPVPKVVDTTTNLPSVTGAFGATPKVTIPSTKPDGTFIVHTLKQGAGAKVTSTDVAVTNFSVVDWNTGKAINTAYAKDSAPLVLTLSAGTLPALSEAVVGHTEGSRVEVVAPPGAATGQMDPSNLTQMGVNAKDTLVFVVDISKKVGAKDDISGKQSPSPANMPSVVAPAGKAATFTIPDSTRKPTKLLTSVLIKGTGPKVLSGQTILVQYTGATLADGKVFDSSWTDAGVMGTVIGQGKVIPGWDQGLVGQTVGSRVLLSIPSALAYGAQGQSPIPANANLVFVVDILGAA